MAKLFLCGFLAFSLVAAAAEVKAADPEREARERYDNAVKLYEEGAYDAALVELNRAAELRPSYKLYYNIGQVRFAMHDYVAAMDAYRQYLDKGGDKVPSSRREQVQKELAQLAQRVSKLTVEVDVAGAEILVDDVPVGTSPLAAPVAVNAGIRLVTVRHADYLPQSRRVTLAGNVQERVSFSLAHATGSTTAPPAAAGAAQPAGTPAPGPATSTPAFAVEGGLGSGPAPEPDRPKHHASSTAVWIGWATTGALAVSATVTGVVALSKNSKLADARDDLTVSDADVDHQASNVQTLAVVTDVLLAGTLVAGGVSLWLTLDHAAAPKPAASGAGRSPSRLRLGVTPRGVRLEGVF
jgi:hypothetical protein